MHPSNNADAILIRRGGNQNILRPFVGKNRRFPLDDGDILVIQDAGAHGHAMGYNYNGRLRCAELMMKPDHSVKLIRRAETMQDYFATLDVDEEFVKAEA